MVENKLFNRFLFLIAILCGILVRKTLVANFGFSGFWGGIGALLIGIFSALVVAAVIVFLVAFFKSLFFDKD